MVCESRLFLGHKQPKIHAPGHLREFIALGRTAPAIFVLNPRLTVGATVSELHLIWAAAEPYEYQNKINFMSIVA